VASASTRKFSLQRLRLRFNQPSCLELLEAEPGPLTENLWRTRAGLYTPDNARAGQPTVSETQSTEDSTDSSREKSPAGFTLLDPPMNPGDRRYAARFAPDIRRQNGIIGKL